MDSEKAFKAGREASWGCSESLRERLSEELVNEFSGVAFDGEIHGGADAAVHEEGVAASLRGADDLVADHVDDMEPQALLHRLRVLLRRRGRLRQ